MKETSEWKKKILSKKGITFLSQVVVLGFVIGLNILGDYLTFKGTMAFIKDPVYWAVMTISLVLVITLMITIRSMRKNKQIADNKNIENNMETVQAVRKVVLINAYDDELQAYIDKVNENKKYETYLNKVTKKINLLNFMPLTAKIKDKLLRKLEMKLKKPREEVLDMNIRFKKITQTGLFAGVDGKLAVESKYDISNHEGKDVASMVTGRALISYVFIAFSGTMAVNFIYNGWSALWGTFLKIFSMALATVSAIQQADKFVEYNIEQALDNRLRIILGFVNSNEQVKSQVLDKLNEKQS